MIRRMKQGGNAGQSAREILTIYWYRSKVLARYISVEKNTVSLYGGVIAKPSRAKEERPWWNKKYISHFAFVLQLER